MRVIKFRAWDRTRQVMIQPALELTNTATLKRYPFPESEPAYSSSDMYDWLEFTGLLDKNGKEIYEGDILSGHSDGLVKVVWRGAGWECDFADDGNIGLDEMCIWFGNNAHIIGNVYANPELLKAK